jgi:hypothetical protein
VTDWDDGYKAGAEFTVKVAENKPKYKIRLSQIRRQRDKIIELEAERDKLTKALETLHVRSQKMAPLDSAWVEDVCWGALEEKR